MGFFEFFFSGPGWGWRFICLLLFLEGLKSIIEVMFNAFIKMHTNAKLGKIISESEKLETDNSHQATKDDFR